MVARSPGRDLSATGRLRSRWPVLKRHELVAGHFGQAARTRGSSWEHRCYLRSRQSSADFLDHMLPVAAASGCAMDAVARPAAISVANNPHTRFGDSGLHGAVHPAARSLEQFHAKPAEYCCVAFCPLNQAGKATLPLHVERGCHRSSQSAITTAHAFRYHAG